MTVTAVDERLPDEALNIIVEGIRRDVHALASELLSARKEIAGLREGLREVLDWYNGDPDMPLDWADCMFRAANLIAGGNSNE